ncbi:hypothetical protein LTR36_009357 [Oleoguttula mirabilis]|uniref:GPI ethanolamine phosphate transferase 2 n=1 Tax=Oleoguttula mirabilis TaxID=1507867 RepID=A0AAV9JSG5_9PEZI|nr:hypothetical protein LTR36_009357 [Oleoguttula mirabilis]
MARSRTTRLVYLTLANLLLPAAVLIFAIGFFPFKPLLPGLATFEDVQETAIWGDGQPEAIFDRVVFMVVDALRSDFVYGYNSGFEFTQSLIRDGAAIPFTAHATPPTVTMPRVKALTTGSVPSFADLIFNLDESGSGSTLATQDTWLAQIKARGGKLVFYGDDTWLRLFPSDGPGGFFERSDGTSSFFVSDFTEVDNNVTRHVPEELERDDWDGMIMHYLGLDHIGHKTGPNGPNMLPKQREMDGVVRQIYEAMETKEHHKNTLLVLAGDHGMNAGGNHGGSGPGETEPALLFASPKLKQRSRRTEYQCPTTPEDGTDFHYYRKVEQSDLVPTLAGLMRLPVSKNSLGVFIDELAGLWSDVKDGVQLLHQNGKQIGRIVEAAYGTDFVEKAKGRKDTCDWTRSGDPKCAGPNLVENELARGWETAREALDYVRREDEGWEATHGALLHFISTAQGALSTAASSYDIPRMATGMVLSAVALALAVLSFPSLWPPTTASLFFSTTSVLYGIMMFASSYVEEEQHFWYWLTPAWILILTAKGASRTADGRHKLQLAVAGVTIVAVQRIAVRWNQTGQKHTGEPDIVHNVFPDYYVFMWAFVLMTYGYECYMLARCTFVDLMPPEIAVIASVVLTVPAVIFKLNFTQADAPELVQGLAYKIREWTASFSLLAQAQLVFAVLALGTLVVVVMAVGLGRNTDLRQQAVRITLAERLHHLLTMFLITQSRATNVPLFLGLEAQSLSLRKLFTASSSRHDSRPSSKPGRNADVSFTELATTTLLLSHTYFFCFGGSNSISSVDLSNAYNGVGDYNIVAVGVLLFTSNWTGPIWWCSAAVLQTFAKPEGPAEEQQQVPITAGRSWIEQERRKLREEAQAVGALSQARKPGQQNADQWLVYVSGMTAFVAISLLAVMVACTALRTHLFIWTVFSPKYLYAMAWSVGWHIVITVGLGGLLRWLGQIA